MGPRSVAVVSIETVQCQAIVNSGSQVTTISKSFHDAYLSSLPIQPLRDILEVEGAGGQNVPYLGYVEVNIQFPENITGKIELISTLALVVPDLQVQCRVSCSFRYQHTSDSQHLQQPSD